MLNLDNEMYKSALKACRASRKWESALQILRTMWRCGVVPSVSSYGAALVAYAEQSKPDLFFWLLEDMAQKRLAIDLTAYGFLMECEQRGFTSDEAALLRTSTDDEWTQCNLGAAGAHAEVMCLMVHGLTDRACRALGESEVQSKLKSTLRAACGGG